MTSHHYIEPELVLYTGVAVKLVFHLDMHVGFGDAQQTIGGTFFHSCGVIWDLIPFRCSKLYVPGCVVL